jgi:hypothetical protein
MALEKRDGNLYYYRSARRGGEVRRVYVCSGELARIAYEQDVMSRVAEEYRRQEERRELEKLKALVAPVLEVDEAAEVLARAHLVAGGFRRHKGEWRRARRSHA